VVGWSGDISERDRAAEAKNDFEISYAIPKKARRCFSTIASAAKNNVPRPTS
jgi:hypothetical protein